MRAVDLTLPTCAICGAPPLVEDYTGVLEFHGHSWQSGDIVCSAKGTVKACSNSVTINFEADQTPKVPEKLRSMWIILNS